MLTLYFSPGACSLAPHIALEESGLAYEAKPIFTKRGDNRKPDYLALNPLGKVPTLVADGKVITENVAILPFIADGAPQKNLLPADREGRAAAISLMAFVTSAIHPNFGPLFRPQNFHEDPAVQEALKTRAKKLIADGFAEVERRIAGKPYALGDTFSVVDGYLMSFWNWAKAMGIDVSPFPAYAAQQQKVLTRDAVRKVLAREDEAKKSLESA